MRILAIRGADLASLAGEFAVELDQGALASSGLFAIVGPTGAGKSTLLDALCAALYNKTPRLDGRSSVKIGRVDEPEELHLSPFDVRALVRRDAVTAWCEVDFEGRDGRRWRARWQTRRARGRVTGRLQEVEQSLVCLDNGERRGGTRGETLAAIEDAVGLSFDQFRRSALLAQGDFAAFLRADVGQRAELLERMTGTAIYGALSIAAHRKAGEVAVELDTLRAALARIAVLDDDARAAHVAAAARAAEAATAARGEVAALEAAVAWRREDEARAAALDQARAQAAAAHAAAATSEAEATALAAALGAPSLDAVRPMLDAAHALDGRLAEARATAAEASRARAAALAAAASARAAAATLADEDARLAEAADDAARWLDAHAHVAPAHADAARVARELRALSAARVALAAAEAGRARAAARLDAATAREAAARAALDGAGAAAQDARSRWEAAEERAKKQPVAAAEARLATLHGEQLALTQLRAAADAAARAAQASADHAAHAAARTADAARSSDDAAAAARARDAARAALIEAEATRDRLRATVDLAGHRAELVDGEPCPLCGAEQHPWAGQGVVASLVADQDARVAALRADADGHAARAAARSSEAAAATREAARAEAAAVEARAELDAARARWRAGVVALGELLLAEDPSGAAAAAWLDARLRAAAEALARTQKEFEAARKRADEARYQDELVRMRRNDVEHAEAAWREADAARRDAADAVATADAARRDAEAAQARALDELAAPLAPWPGAVVRLDAADGAALDAFAEEVAATLARYAQERARLDDAAARRAALAVRVAEARAHGAQAADAEARARAATDDAEARAAALAADRAALLGGRTTADAAAAVDAARARTAAARAAAGAADAVVAERDGRLTSHRAAAAPDQARALPDLVAALDAARAALAAADDDHRRAALALELDDDARARRAEAEADLARRAGDALVHQQLAELIGSHDGKKLRTFAQSLSLDGLLAAANHHLGELAPRYRLERVRGHDLELQVVDRDLGDEVRSVNSLSGGEGFLVSLALALGLSSLSAKNVRVRTLLIDEGFGTLDPATLDVALDVLDTLQSAGRQVGIISHVPGLAERVPAQVVVRPVGGGRSVVAVRAAS